MRIAYLVSFQVMTRVVVNTETKREDEEENAMTAAIEKILKDPNRYIITDNVDTVNEDKECPAGKFGAE